MSPDGSELRAAFDEWVRREIERLEQDPPARRDGGCHPPRRRARNGAGVAVGCLGRLRLALEADAANPTGRTVTISKARWTTSVPCWRPILLRAERVHAAVQGMVASLLPAAQARSVGLHRAGDRRLGPATIMERLELRVGKDLQFVRVNGTLVGFLVGGLLYWALRATFGHVSF